MQYILISHIITENWTLPFPFLIDYCKVRYCFYTSLSRDRSKGDGVPCSGTSPPTVQNFLNFMQFFGKFAKTVCCCPLPEACRPSYRQSWIRPCCLFTGGSLYDVTSCLKRGFCLKGVLCEGGLWTKTPVDRDPRTETTPGKRPPPDGGHTCYACFGKSRREVTTIVNTYKIKKHLSITMATFLHCARASSSVSVRLFLGSSRSKTPDTLPCMNTPREMQSIIIWKKIKEKLLLTLVETTKFAFIFHFRQ